MCHLRIFSCTILICCNLTIYLWTPPKKVLLWDLCLVLEGPEYFSHLQIHRQDFLDRSQLARIEVAPQNLFVTNLEVRAILEESLRQARKKREKFFWYLGPRIPHHCSNITLVHEREIIIHTIWILLSFKTMLLYIVVKLNSTFHLT